MSYNNKQKNDKLAEINLRKERLNYKPICLNENKNDQDLSKFLDNSSSLKLFNSEYAYKPVELVGKFDHSNTFKLKSLENGTYGYKILTPFYYNLENEENKKVIIVDRGFAEERQEENLFDSRGYVKLTGLLKYPQNTFYSKENDLSDVNPKLNSLNLNDINDLIFDEVNSKKISEDSISRKILIEQYDPNNNSIFPRQIKKDDLLTKFNATPEAHSFYSKVFGLVTFSVIYGNVFFWISL